MKQINIWLLAALLCLPAAAGAQEPLRLTQQTCRAMALSHSEELAKAANVRKQAEMDRAIARAACLPKIDGSAGAAYMLPDFDMTGMHLQMRGTYMAGISLVLPLYAGGKIRAANRLAQIGEDVAREAMRKTRMEVLADADRAYWTYIAVRMKVRMLESYVAQMDTLFAQTEAGVAAGMATENDLLRIKAGRGDICYQLQKARNGADLCRLSLCSVVGCAFETPIEPADTVIAVVAPAALDESIESRPDVRLLQKQVEMAGQQVRMARAALLPQVGLSAGYLYFGNVKMKGAVVDAAGNMQPYTQKFDQGNFLAMASVSIPLLHWGENAKKVKKARLDLENAQLDLQKNRRLMSIEVRQAVQNVATGHALVETARLADGQARENLRVVRNSYGAGMSGLTELLEAQAQWRSAQSNLIEAQTQCKIYETEYLRATGRLE